MRCFFNLADAGHFIPDDEGVEVRGINELCAELAEIMTELREEDPFAAEAWKGWRLEVADASGAVVLRINLDPSSPQFLLSLFVGALALVECLQFCKHLADVLPHAFVV